MIRAALTSAVAAIWLVTAPTNAGAADPKTTYEQLNLFGDVFELVRARYVGEVNELRLVNAAIDSMLTSLDPHSSFMDAETYGAMQERTSGEFGGLGIEVRMDEGFVLVVRPMPDTPAERAGVEAGDHITHLDGNDVTGMALSDAVDLMRGRVNSTIELTVEREGVADPFTITVTRAVIRMASVRYRVEGNAAYILITSFSEQTESGIKRAMTELKAELGDDFEGVILDLRGNPGGLLEQSVAATEAFLNRGEVVATRARDPSRVQRYTARRGDLADGKPIIVLINGGSASASEIVAGALQDHQRALIVGTRSFGKGSVQTIMPMGVYGAMRLTTSRYYTPSGRSIQGTGITPDVVVEQAQVEPLFPKPPEIGPDGQEIVPFDTGPIDYQLSRALDLLHAMAVFQGGLAAN